MKVSLIIPFKNEEDYAALTLQRVLSFFATHAINYEIIAVDDSTDATWDILQRFESEHQHIFAVKGGTPSGYGKAIKKGFRAATGDILIPFNGDCSDSLEDVIKFVALIERGNDMVFGSRYMRGASVTGAPASKQLLSKVGNRFLQVLFQTSCSDLTNSFKAYKRNVIEDLTLTSNGYTIVIETALKSILKKHTYTTIPVSWSGREHGVSKMSILKAMVNYLVTAFKIRLGNYE
ncbi:MAG: glycosyltransferase family 2 protein [Flammeovirgaceae bacterium]